MTLEVLKKGIVLFPDGSIWKGTIHDFEWAKTGGYPSEFTFIGEILAHSSREKKKEKKKGRGRRKVKKRKHGIWKCVDTGWEYKVIKIIG